MTDVESLGTDEVLVASSWSRSGKIYHTNTNCEFLTDRHKPRKRSDLPHDYEPCQGRECEGSPGEPAESRTSLRDLISTGQVEIDYENDVAGGDA